MMKLDFIYSFDEFLALNDALLKRRPRAKLNRILSPVIILLCLAYGIWRKVNGDTSIVPILMFVLGLFLIALHFLKPVILRRSFKNQMMDGKRIRMTFDSTGMAVVSDESEHKHLWSAIIRAHEEPDHFILWTSKIIGIAFPKSAFADDAEITEFRQLIATYVKDQEMVK